MRLDRITLCFVLASLVLASCASAQVESPTTSAVISSSTQPRLIRLHGVIQDEQSVPITGSVDVTFSVYADQTTTNPLWQETQNVTLDATGHYNVLVGVTSETGLPLDIFAAGEARWVGIRPAGHMEQPRFPLVSVAYALKAADADMLGGKPASAFVLADQSAGAAPMYGVLAGSTPPSGAQMSMASTAIPLTNTPGACSALTSDGTATANQLAKFTTACNIENSAIFESGGNVGIGTTSPSGTLDVAGTGVFTGSLTAGGGAVIAPSGTATTSLAYISNPLDIEASVFNTTLGRAVDYIFRWQTEPTGNDSTTTGQTLNLLYGVTGALSETGITVNNKGIMTFAPGQTFPGQGTVTSVATGAGLTGGPITTSGTISIPSAGVTNAMLANSTINVTAGSGLSGGGAVALGGTVTLTGNLSGTKNGIGYFNGGSSITSTAAPTNGQILIGSTSNAPVLSTLTAGQNINITNAPGAVTISATGGSGTVTNVATGAGLTGGPITSSGTISIPSAGVTNSMLANSTINVTAGAGLSGGGAVALGGTVTLTGNLSGTKNGIGYFSGGSSLTSTAAPTNGQILIGSTSNAPVLSTLTAGQNVTITNAPGAVTISATGGGTGTVTNVATGAGLTGGPITTSGTISIPSAGVTNAMLADNTINVAAGSGLSGGGAVALGGTVTLTGNLSGTKNGIGYFSGGSSLTSTAAPTNGQILIGSTGSTPVLSTLTAGQNISITNAPGAVTITATGGGTGTVTNVATGAGLTGGPITTSGTISIPSAGVTNAMLANSAITVQPGSGLAGGGAVALGGSVTLNANISGTKNGISYFNGGASVTSTAAPTDGQILIGSTGSAPVLSTLTAGDNVTITNASGAITISAASGSGTALPQFVTGSGSATASQTATQNINTVWGFLLPYSVTTSQITYEVTATDNTANKYDLGIFSNAGSLVADLGALSGTSFAPSKGFHTLNWQQGSVTLSPGRYYFALTTSCSATCSSLGASSLFVSFAVDASAGASSGGTLPVSITPPADRWAAGNQPVIVIH